MKWTDSREEMSSVEFYVHRLQISMFTLAPNAPAWHGLMYKRFIWPRPQSWVTFQQVTDSNPPQLPWIDFLSPSPWQVLAAARKVWNCDCSCDSGGTRLRSLTRGCAVQSLTLLSACQSVLEQDTRPQLAPCGQLSRRVCVCVWAVAAPDAQVNFQSSSFPLTCRIIVAFSKDKLFKERFVTHLKVSTKTSNGCLWLAVSGAPSAVWCVWCLFVFNYI